MALLRSLGPDETQRYERNGFDLNLSYILPNIIAVSYPRTKAESLFLNNVSRVRRFLDETHGHHYFVYNITTEINYSPKKFHGRVGRYPVEDYSPPPMMMMLAFCKDVDDWLSQHPLNVAVVHCHAGKGRSGTMICAFLLYKRIFYSAEDAVQCFHDRRMKNGVKAFHPGAARYVRYFDRLIKQRLIYRPKPLLLYAIEFNSCPALNGILCSPFFTVSHTGGQRKYKSSVYSAKSKRRQLLMYLPVPIPVIGDVKVIFYDLQLLGKTKLFWLWFNTAFVDGPFEELVVNDEVDDGFRTYPDGWQPVPSYVLDRNDGSTPRPACLTSVVNVQQNSDAPHRQKRFLTLSFPRQELDRKHVEELLHIVDANFKVKFYFTPNSG